MKKCRSPKCEHPLKDESEFNKNRTKSDGLEIYCRVCTRAKSRVATAKYLASEKGKATLLRYYNKPGSRERLGAWKKTEAGREYIHKHSRLPRTRFWKGACQAKRRGKTWNLTFEEYMSVTEGKACHYCDGNLPVAGCGLDRMDNDRGYEIGNVVPCCERCNSARGTHFTYEDFRDNIAPGIRAIEASRCKAITDTLSVDLGENKCPSH
jgi:hypothetical protein